MSRITPVQIRMAKAALGWSNTELARRTGPHRNTINRAENGEGRPATFALLKQVFEEEGVVFVPEGKVSEGGGAGVRYSR